MKKAQFLKLVKTVIIGNEQLTDTLGQILKNTARAKNFQYDKAKDGWILLEDIPTGKFSTRKWKPGWIIGDTITRVGRDRFCRYAGPLGQIHAETMAAMRPRWDIGLYTGCNEVWILFPHTLWYNPRKGLMMPYVFTRDWKLDFVSASESFDYNYTVLVRRE